MRKLKVQRNETNIYRRTLSVYTKFRSNRYDYKRVPEIRLCGNWVEKLGFKEGELIDITAEHGTIKISLF
ncbi:MAG: type I addiction module toxin, SymE family [Chitinophagaceae bacterium]|nr:MAG: type I addiction module toxin, SymE family [Chitinophagaceae bacterium]